MPSCRSSSAHEAEPFIIITALLRSQTKAPLILFILALGLIFRFDLVFAAQRSRVSAGARGRNMAVAGRVAEVWGLWDEAVSDAVFGMFEAVFGEDIRGKPCPHTIDLPTVRTPTVLVTWALLYVLNVSWGFFAVGPTEKQKNAPSSSPLMKKVVNVHNLFLIGLSTYMFGSACYHAYLNNYKFWGQPYNADEKGMAYAVWIFYMSKLYEYNDTYIMLLKGNLRQVSFLHCYHHLSISLIWWAITYSSPGGDAWYSMALNSLIHMFMYTYYYLASISSGDAKFRKKYLWWGKYMTSAQMFQFATMMAQGIYCLMYSEYPRWLCKLISWYMGTLLILFAHFFKNKYSSGQKPKQKTK